MTLATQLFFSMALAWFFLSFFFPIDHLIQWKLWFARERERESERERVHMISKQRRFSGHPNQQQDWPWDLTHTHTCALGVQYFIDLIDRNWTSQRRGFRTLSALFFLSSSLFSHWLSFLWSALKTAFVIRKRRERREIRSRSSGPEIIQS